MTDKKHIEIVPLNEQGFVRGFPGVPPNALFERGATIGGVVQISLPLLGVPASSVEIEWQKTEKITVNGQKPATSIEQLGKTVLWDNVFLAREREVRNAQYPFSFPIPEELPPTVSLGSQGIDIQYSLHATVYRSNKMSWNSKPLSCTVPFIIVKYERHPAWPIYRHSKSDKFKFDNGSIRLYINPSQTCYGSGEIISLTAELLLGNYTIVPRSIEFEARLQEEVVVTLTIQPSGFRQARSSNKKTITVTKTVSQHTTTCTKSGNATEFTADLAVQVPGNDISPTLTSPNVNVTYVLVVSTNIHSHPLRVDVPIIISPLTSRSFVTEIQQLGPVPCLGGNPFSESSSDSPHHVEASVEHFTEQMISEIDVTPEGDEIRAAPREERVTSFYSTILDDDHSVVGLDLTAFEFEYRGADFNSFNGGETRRSSMVRTPAPSFASLDSDLLSQLGGGGSAGSGSIYSQDSQSRAVTPVPTSSVAHAESYVLEDLLEKVVGLSEETGKPPSLRTINLIGNLEEILSSHEAIEALMTLRGDQAQVVIDFLDLVLPELDPQLIWLREHALIALYRLCKASYLHPYCHSLRDIAIDSQEDGDGFYDVFKGRHGDQALCLKVVRQLKKTKPDRFLNVFSKEAILWNQLNHPNVLPFYGVYYLEEERRRICLVSPWMENGNIVRYLQENPHAPRRPFICDVIKGLEYLHRKNIIHGDLKGANILVTTARRACIADFGKFSAILEERSIVQAEARSAIYRGSYRWIAPELLDDSNSYPTSQSDVWAFGCVCYQIMTRCLPYYEIDADPSVITMVVRGGLPKRPPPASDLVSLLDTIDNEIWALFRLCWSFKPEYRPTCQQIMGFLKLFSPEQAHCVDQNDDFAKFRRAMRATDDPLLDLPKVGRIFNDILE